MSHDIYPPSDGCVGYVPDGVTHTWMNGMNAWLAHDFNSWWWCYLHTYTTKSSCEVVSDRHQSTRRTKPERLLLSGGCCSYRVVFVMLPDYCTHIWVLACVLGYTNCTIISGKWFLSCVCSRLFAWNVVNREKSNIIQTISEPPVYISFAILLNTIPVRKSEIGPTVCAAVFSVLCAPFVAYCLLCVFRCDYE